MFDNLWRLAASKAVAIAGVICAAGLLLFGFGLYLGLNSVSFDGHLKAIDIPVEYDGAGLAVPMHIVKEVGFFLAPNWLLTGIALLPMAIFYLLRTRASIEPLIGRMVERDMIVTLKGEPAGLEAILAIWRRHSRWWSNVASIIFIAAIAFTFIADFLPVVLRWNLATPEAVRDFVTGENITLGNPTYEFDWSVASTFRGSRIDGWLNLAFAFLAYLVIPMFGSAVLFSAMTWFFATHSVFSSRSLAAEGFRIAPDASSDDPRCGFEVFEEFFSNLVRATFFTAMIVVCMHLQNVFLRSPKFSNILEMTFGNKLQDIVTSIGNRDFGGIIDALTSLTLTLDALDMTIAELSPQTYVAAVALAMLAVIVFGMVWGWLRQSAMRGRDDMLAELNEKSTRPSKLKTKLKSMRVWPLGWADLNTVLAAVVIVAGCMIWSNFLILVLAFVLVLAATQILNYVRTSIWTAMTGPR
ncbi:MAG: hypothetical protein ABI414_13685 [Devosia sp.]